MKFLENAQQTIRSILESTKETAIREAKEYLIRFGMRGLVAYCFNAERGTLTSLPDDIDKQISHAVNLIRNTKGYSPTNLQSWVNTAIGYQQNHLSGLINSKIYHQVNKPLES